MPCNHRFHSQRKGPSPFPPVLRQKSNPCQESSTRRCHLEKFQWAWFPRLSLLDGRRSSHPTRTEEPWQSPGCAQVSSQSFRSTRQIALPFANVTRRKSPMSKEAVSLTSFSSGIL